MKCPSCQSENLPDSRYCHKCATPLPSAEATTPIVPVEPGTVRTKTYFPPFEDLGRGKIFAGRYEVIEEIGKGGMGKVYKVFDEKINEVVALKLIKPEIGFNEKAIERFKNELKTARRISHRHVCRLFDLGESGVTHYITMEYVEGEDLKNFIRRAGQITASKAVAIAKQICEGLTEAHRLGIVHRDLKPQNVMIDREGNARIMDFGLARFQEGEGVTGSGVILGTPEYMSPEQVELKDVDRRSDLYSLGVILFEMVTGRVPFEGETPLGIAIKHKSEKPRDPRDINPLVPESLSRTISRCLEKDPGRRFQTSDELLRALTETESGLPSGAKDIPKKGPASSEEIIGRMRALRKIILSAIIAVVGLIVLVALLKNLGQEIRNAVVPSQKPAVGKESPRAQPAPAKISQGLKKPGPVDETGQMGMALSKLLDSKARIDVGEMEKLIEGFKNFIPDKGPYRDAYTRVLEKIDETRKEESLGQRAPQKSGAEVRGDMQELLALVAERESVQKAKDSMLGAKTKAEKKPGIAENLLFRLAAYEEANADDAFGKNDYSGARALYRILEKTFDLSTECEKEVRCIEALSAFVNRLKAEAMTLPPASVDSWLLEYARGTEKQALVYIANKELDNGGGALIRAAFLYEKILESAAAVK
jgi:serine/threonine protein kinase